MKYCLSCKDYLEESAFYKDSAQVDGLHSKCKKCDNQRRKAYAEKKKEQESLTYEI